MDHLLGILLGQGLKALIALDGLLDGADLLAGHIAGQVLTLLARLNFVKGTGGTFLNHR